MSRARLRPTAAARSLGRPGLRSPTAALLGVGVLVVSALAPGSRAQTRVTPSPVVWIPEGSFVMGADAVDVGFAVQLCQDEHELTLADECGPERFAHETPATRIFLSRFGLDRTEVTRAQYQRCVAAGACVPSLVSDDGRAEPTLPVVAIDAASAARYCAFMGGRLPTEAEWEKAARGTVDRRRFPWGELYDGGLANHGRPPLRADASDGYAGLSPVGVMPGGVSPYGLLDMAGNAWEWTASRPRASDVGSPDRLADLRVVRGGSYLHPAVSLRVTARAWLAERSARVDLGVRCAYDPP